MSVELPNVLWISTHDINPHLGAYSGVWPGAECAITPNLDRLAAEGIRFDNAFATAPVCAPSRSSIYTGCYPTALGTMHMRSKAVPPAEVKLLPELFREAGYYTANNWFTDFQMDVPPTAYDDLGMTAHWRGRPEGKPFFVAFHGMVTHESSIYLDDDKFAAATANVPASARQDINQVQIPPYYPDTEVFRKAWARYLELITEMDHWVGGILDQLDEDGLSGNTIVVFWSDHGLGMPRAKRWASEAGVREPLIVRWPGRIPAGTTTESLVSLADLAPTMLSACGLEVPGWMQGHPILSADGEAINANEFVFSSRDRMDEAQDTSRTVRDARYRLVRHEHPDRPAMQYCHYPDHLETWTELRRLAKEESNQLGRGEEPSLFTPLQRSLVAPSKPRIELYDILVDPHEERNLAEDPAHAADVARLESALDQWQGTYGDLGLVPETQLMQSWRPGGLPQQVDPVRVSRNEDGSVFASCDTPGARIGWTNQPPEPPREPTPVERMLGLETDGRTWQIAQGAIPDEGDIYVKAWRPGFDASEELAVTSITV